MQMLRERVGGGIWGGKGRENTGCLANICTICMYILFKKKICSQRLFQWIESWLGSKRMSLVFPGASDGKDYETYPSSCVQLRKIPAVQETWVWSLGREDPLEKGMATLSSILAWRISWTEELGRLQSIGLQRLRHDWATNTFTSFLPPLPGWFN